ncbi:MAG TPA: hypothetical protein VHO47_00560 [Candidatus Babeliales bacterium]|nr:hypothetical protein [Candidatus Babeliales bacterium]
MKKNLSKKKLALSLLIIVLNGPLVANSKPLQHRALAMVDGLPHPIGVDWKTVDEMVHTIKEVLKGQFGVRQRNSKDRMGIFTFRNSLYSIQGLATLERSALETNDRELLNDLENHLVIFRTSFIEIMRPMLTRLQGLPQRTAHELMKEWADLHNRHDSIIFEWCKHRAGSEEELFHNLIASFKNFDQFCSDVVSFLDDLIKSCPIGYQQYLDAIHQKT